MQLSIVVSNNIYFLEPHSKVPGVKRPGRVSDEAPSSDAEVEKGGNYTSTSHQFLLPPLKRHSLHLFTGKGCSV
jgi:hypothetical protein